jgi:hypothetical protein
MQKRIKFCLSVEYNAPQDVPNETSNERLLEAHQQVFEDNPGSFIDYILGRKESTISYEFTPLEVGQEFDCGLYFYHAESKNNLCLKYGALCSNTGCKNNE